VTDKTYAANDLQDRAVLASLITVPASPGSKHRIWSSLGRRDRGKHNRLLRISPAGCTPAVSLQYGSACVIGTVVVEHYYYRQWLDTRIYTEALTNKEIMFFLVFDIALVCLSPPFLSQTTKPEAVRQPTQLENGFVHVESPIE
jgi:hypothetical protein